MKTYQALAKLLALRLMNNTDRPAIAQAIKDIVALFRPVGDQGYFAINYDGCDKPTLKISLKFGAEPPLPRSRCFAHNDGLLHGYIEICSDLVHGCVIKVRGSGSAEINDMAKAEAAQRLFEEVPAPIGDIVTKMAEKEGIRC